MRTLTPYWHKQSLSAGLFDDMEQLFAALSPARVYDERAPSTGLNPSYEVNEAEGHYLLSVDLPGLKKSDIKIDVQNSVLTVSGERKRDEKSLGVFKRSFTLPSTLDTQKIEARYEDGVLELYLPKAEVAKPRQISIETGERSGFFEKLLGAKKSTTDETKSAT